MASKEGMVGLHPDSGRSGHNVSGSSSGIALNALIVIRVNNARGQWVVKWSFDPLYPAWAREDERERDEQTDGFHLTAWD